MLLLLTLVSRLLMYSTQGVAGSSWYRSLIVMGL